MPVKRPSARVRAKQAQIKQKFRTILLILVRNRNISTIKKGDFTTRRELFNRRNKKARASTLAFSEDRHFGQSQLNVTTEEHRFLRQFEYIMHYVPGKYKILGN